MQKFPSYSSDGEKGSCLPWTVDCAIWRDRKTDLKSDHDTWTDILTGTYKIETVSFPGQQIGWLCL